MSQQCYDNLRPGDILYVKGSNWGWHYKDQVGMTFVGAYRLLFFAKDNQWSAESIVSKTGDPSWLPLKPPRFNEKLFNDYVFKVDKFK